MIVRRRADGTGTSAGRRLAGGAVAAGACVSLVAALVAPADLLF